MKGNLFSNVLMVLIGLLLLLSAVQMFGWGTQVSPVEPVPTDPAMLPTLDAEQAENIHRVAVETDLDLIAESPLFNEERVPYVAVVTDEVVEEQAPEEAVQALQAKLTGVVITPENSYAMVQDTLSNTPVRLKVGMPLEGDQGGWVVDRIEPRKVVFVADGMDPQELELEVYTGQLGNGNARAAAQRVRNAEAQERQQQAQAAAAQEQQKKATSAEEIRRKIAERRAQMRAEAAKRNQQNDQQ